MYGRDSVDAGWQARQMQQTPQFQQAQENRLSSPYTVNDGAPFHDGFQSSSTRIANPESNLGTGSLPQPHLPWITAEPSISGRSSMSARSIDTPSLHVVKSYSAPSITKKRQRWSKHKWWLLFANSIMFIYSLAGLVVCLLTWFKLYLRADVIIVGENLILVLSTVSSAICLATSFLGYAGIMLNSRPILAVYNFMMWPCFAMIASIGYVSYRKAKWNLDGKLSYQWHYGFSPSDRARVQANLHCCGYKEFSDFPERSNKCFPRTLLPGCKFKYSVFTAQGLKLAWIISFGLLPLHIFVLVVGLMCSNHVNRKFGKGLPPKIYHLDYRPGLFASTPNASVFNLAKF